MAGLVDRIAQMRNPLIYGVDIVGGLRALGLRGTRRTMVSSLALTVGIAGGVTAVGAGALEATDRVLEHGVADTLVSPQSAELVGVVLGVSALAGVVQGIHQVSRAGQEAREVRRERKRPRERRSQWLL